jgi:hypothetical protein
MLPSHSQIHSGSEVQTNYSVQHQIWQVFGNDNQIEDFLQCKNEFECTNIDLENNDDDVNKSFSETCSVNKVDYEDLNEIKVDADELNENEIDFGIL